MELTGNKEMEIKREWSERNVFLLARYFALFFLFC